jgi:hypothetical protein
MQDAAVTTQVGLMMEPPHQNKSLKNSATYNWNTNCKACLTIAYLDIPNFIIDNKYTKCYKTCQQNIKGNLTLFFGEFFT